MGRVNQAHRNVNHLERVENHIHDLIHASKLDWYARVLTQQCRKSEARCQGGGKARTIARSIPNMRQQHANGTSIKESKMAGSGSSRCYDLLDIRRPPC